MTTSLSTTILLVEDNEDDCFFFRRALQKAGITNPLQVVTNGELAVDYLAGQGNYKDRQKFPVPFLVFLDLKLPYLNGFDVLTWVNQQAALRSMVVVVLTSSSEDRDQTRAYSLGARTYLVKPPQPKDITDVLDSLTPLWGGTSATSPIQN